MTKRHGSPIGAQIKKPGRAPYESRVNYVPGASGKTRPARDDTYLLDGTEHRFDGACHPDCENVR